MFNTEFDTFVCECDSISCSLDGITYRARLVRDEDTNPHDYDQPGWVFDTTDAEHGAVSRKILAAWDRDEWCYFGVVIDAERGAWKWDAIVSVWGIEGNFPANTTGNPNLYFRTAASELLPQAVEAVKASLVEAV